MTNTTYKQKIGNAIIGTGVAIGWLVGMVTCTGLSLFCVVGKKAFEYGEKLAEKGQCYTAEKATENLGQAGSDIKEAYDLYRKKSIEAKKEEKVELIDEGYSSGSEGDGSKSSSKKK